MKASDSVPAECFRDLIVWQRAIELATAIYSLTASFPREELFGMSAQMRKAAVSVSSNIAEGQGRLTSGEFRQFLGIARGSNFEIQTQIEIARRMGMGDPTAMQTAEKLSHEVGKMIYSILVSLRNR